MTSNPKSVEKDTKPSLYGIKNSNRDFSNPYYWGKNQFNSSFPVSLSCYMRDKDISSVYLRLSKNRKIFHEEISFNDVFNTNLRNDELYFAFESRFDSFADFVHDELKSIDLVVKENKSKKPIRPIEIKLTTLPDNTTADLTDENYGTEMVVRSPTMRYMALSMAESCQKKFDAIHKIFEPVCARIRDWDNIHEIKNHLPQVVEALEEFFEEFRKYERPLLIQPVWKTVGKSPKLAEHCLDIFTWSDFALSRLFMDSANDSAEEAGDKITRQQRAAIRLARFLYDVSRNRKVYQQPIYDGMTYGTLNDKGFSVTGVRMNSYMKCDRLTKPAIRKDEIKRIILGGGQKHLSPERRFDAIIYFSRDLFDE